MDGQQFDEAFENWSKIFNVTPIFGALFFRSIYVSKIYHAILHTKRTTLIQLYTHKNAFHEYKLCFLSLCLAYVYICCYFYLYFLSVCSSTGIVKKGFPGSCESDLVSGVLLGVALNRVLGQR